MEVSDKTITNVQVPDGGQAFLERVQQSLLKVIQVLGDKGWMLGFAESCTGGLLSSLMTKHSGVSEVFWGSVVSYSNESKSLFLNVDSEIFKKHGAVSAQCAIAMSQGLHEKISQTTQKNIITVSLTGVAGPTGGSDLKPVGTVFIAVSGTNKASKVFHHEFVIKKDKAILTDRECIQYAAALQALMCIETYLN